jgi:acyl-CoA thioester hydrolase
MKTDYFKNYFRVRYSETDQMGVVYYANFLVWFEIARTELLREIGLVYTELEENGIIMPAVHAETRYLASAHYDEEIEVQIGIQHVKNVSITFLYEVYRISDKVKLATGSTKHAILNRKNKITPLPMEISKKLKQNKFYTGGG